MKLHCFADAVESFKKCCSLTPDDAESHSNLGAAYKYIGEKEKACRCYQRSIQLKPNHFPAIYNLALLQYELGNFKEAKALIQNAIKIGPTSCDAINVLGQIEERLQNKEEAKNLYSKAIELCPEHTGARLNRWRLLFHNLDYDAALIDSEATSKQGYFQSLVTLYKLNRQSEINERLEQYNSSSPHDLEIAAFVTFYETVMRTKTHYNFFCRDPFSYLLHGNLGQQLESAGTSIDKIKRDLSMLARIPDPVGLATVNGFQTPSGGNLFKDSLPSIVLLKRILTDEIKRYYRTFKNNPCRFISDWPKLASLHGWQVVLKQMGHQTAHLHPGGWLSGVFYLQTVPDLDQNEGSIEFSTNGPYFSGVNAKRLMISPKEGDILLFPSSLYHRTVPFKTNVNRIIIAFDLIRRE